jgi:hypothetical protein
MDVMIGGIISRLMWGGRQRWRRSQVEVDEMDLHERHKLSTW